MGLKGRSLEENMEQKNWYALYIASRQEKKVMQCLQTKNLECYAPMVKTMRQWSDRKKMVDLPLLKGYVFVHLKPIERELVFQVRGIVNYVRSAGKDAVVQDHEILRLKQIVELGYHIEVLHQCLTYREGDKVKITAGPLKNIEGYIVQSKNEKFMDIQLECIGKSIRVKLPVEILESA